MNRNSGRKRCSRRASSSEGLGSTVVERPRKDRGLLDGEREKRSQESLPTVVFLCAEGIAARRTELQTRLTGGDIQPSLTTRRFACLRIPCRHGLMRAMKSLKRYPLPITTEKEACALEGVGRFTARRMLRGLPLAGPEPDKSSGVIIRRTDEDEENVEPSGSSSSRGGGGGGARKASNDSTRSSSVTNAGAGSRLPSDTNSLLRMNLRVGSSATTTTGGRSLSLASNFAALRGGGGETTPDVTPKRPTSRARREEAGGETVRSSKAPSFFSGQWEAWLIVDNREHEFMSVQVRVREGWAGGVLSKLFF